MDHEDDDSAYAELAESLIRGFGSELVKSGQVDLFELSHDEFVEIVRSELRKSLAAGESISITLDYQRGLLAEARRFRDDGPARYAVVFYATWIEHWFNSMFAWKAESLALPRDDIDRLMRQSIVDKAGLLWRLCFLEAFPDDLKKSVLRIAEQRNKFVHYKWRGVDMDELARETHAGNLDLLSLAESVVIELDEMENVVVYGGLRAQAQNGWRRPTSGA